MNFLLISQMEEEFTVARLFVSKMKSEAKNLVSRAATLEQQQAEANRRTEEMEKELSESRLTIVQVSISDSGVSHNNTVLRTRQLNCAAVFLTGNKIFHKL